MKAKVLSIALAMAAVPQANAAIQGGITTSNCAPGRASQCNEAVSIRIGADSVVTGADVSVFVAVFPMSGGQPNTALGGYYDGGSRSWRVSGTPVAAFSGSFQPTQWSTSVPGGICELIRGAGGQPGAYVLMAGYGRNGTVSSESSINPEEIEQAIRDADDPQIAEQLRSLLKDYEQASSKVRETAGVHAVGSAYVDMKQRETLWQVAPINCTGESR